MIQQLQLLANGLRFNVLTAGPATGDLVLLLHGFPQFADSWLPLFEPLAASGFRVVALDQRGYSPGARPTQLELYGIDNLVADALAIANHFEAPGFHLVGHDWGGLVAWRLATRFPHRLHTLTSLTTPHIDAFQQALRSDLDQVNKSKYILLFKAPPPIPETLFLAADAAVLRRVYGGVVPPEQLERNITRLREPGALTAAFNWYRALSPSLAIGPCTVPTLYLWADHDIALGETAALATAQYCTGPYRFVRMRGKSHWLLEDSTAEVIALLNSHLLTHRAHASG